MKKYFILTLFIITGISAFAQSLGDFGNKTNGTWTTLTNWATWDGTGFNTPATTLPTSDKNVFIQPSTTDTLDDPNAACNNLTIDGILAASKLHPFILTVNGNVLVDAGGTFKVSSNTLTIPQNLRDSIVVYGDFTNLGTMDFRTGTNGSTLTAINTTFAGASNSTITMGTYSTANNEFSTIHINKTGGAKVICGSDVVQSSGNSTNLPARLNFISGKIYTGNFTWVLLSTNSADLMGTDSTHYVVGTMGRGMSTSAGKSNVFPIGDSVNYRPFNIRSTTSQAASGAYVKVSCIFGDANTGSSVLTSDIDKVSAVRYFKITYNDAVGAGAQTMSFDRFAPSYGLDDGVAPGNNHLRVAYSRNNRVNWIGLTQTTHTDSTSLTTIPKTIYSDSLVILTVSVNNPTDTNVIYVALARLAGTTENSLVTPTTDIKESSVTPLNFNLSQNYPNPFNPSTMINYSVKQRSFVSLKIYDVVGREVITLVNGEREQGSYQVNFNARNLSNGVYFYKLTAGNFTDVKKMILLK